MLSSFWKETLYVPCTTIPDHHQDKKVGQQELGSTLPHLLLLPVIHCYSASQQGGKYWTNTFVNPAWDLLQTNGVFNYFVSPPLTKNIHEATSFIREASVEKGIKSYVYISYGYL